MGLTFSLYATNPRPDLLKKMNICLEVAGLPQLTESGYDVNLVRAESSWFPEGSIEYPRDWLHCLRRVLVRHRLNPAWQPDLTEDFRNDEIYLRFCRVTSPELKRMHLVYHSDTDGLYVPIPFGKVEFSTIAPGKMTGSSQVLMRELIEVGPLLGFAWNGERPPESETTRLFEETEGHLPLFREKLVFAALYELARLSIRFETMIVFD